MENIIERRVTVTNIIKGFDNAKSTLRVACGTKVSDSGKLSLLFASVAIEGKFLTPEEMIEQVAKLAKATVKLPTTGKGSLVEVKVQGSMPGVRFACLAAYQNGSAKPSVCTQEQYIDHLEKCGIALISETLDNNSPSETNPPITPNVGNRADAIEAASQTNPRKAKTTA